MFRISPVTRSLTAKVIIFFFIGGTMPMILLTIFTSITSRNIILESTREQIKSKASDSILRIENFLSERKSDARVLAGLPVIREIALGQGQIISQTWGYEEKLRFFEHFRGAYGYSVVSLLGTQGNVILSTDEKSVKPDVVERVEFQRALKGETALSAVRARPGPVGSPPVRYFHIAAPIYGVDQRTVAGIVYVEMPLDKVDGIVLSDTNQSGEGSYSVLMDEYLIRISNPSHPELILIPTVSLSDSERQSLMADGRYRDMPASVMLASVNLPEVRDSAKKLLNGEKYVFFKGLTAANGVPSQAVIFHIREVNWFYLHRVPEVSFYKRVNQQAMYAWSITAIAALVAMAAMVIAAHFLLGRPLASFIAAAKAIAHGELSRRIHLKRRDEIGMLAENFNSMAEALQSRIAREQEAQQEARRLQEAERENREHLERVISRYLEFVQHIASGNLSRKISFQQGDEMLQSLADSLNRMVDSLRSITSEVKEASNSIATASAEILAATTQQASSTAQQSSAITQATTTVEEVKKIAQQTAQQAGQVTQESQKTLEIARRGTQAVENTIKGMGEIRKKVESIAQTILGLSEQTQAIGAITQTVSEIADQSNMLALNAAIEAARAGEQGKSFAVVAQQVRELAERSKAATVQVKEILSEIQRATNTAVMVTEEGTKGVEIGVRLASEAGQVIHQIAREVENGAQANAQMAAAAHQQMIGMDQIGQAMRAIQQATTQTLASTRQAEAAARELNMLAQSLQKTVAIYQI